MKHWWLSISAAGLMLLSGCGKPAPASLATNPMASPAMELGHSASDPRKFRALFVDGTAPNEAERKRYGQLVFIVSDVHPESESQGTVHVLVDNDAGKRIGEVDWTVVKAGEKWRLKTAALP